MSNAILTFNGGASGIKFAVYEPGISPAQMLYGEIKNAGTESAIFHFLDSSSPQKKKVPLVRGDLDTTLFFLMECLEKQAVLGSIKAAGHRIAYGSKQKTAQLITCGLLSELKKDYDDAEKHFSLDTALIEIFKSRHPKLL